MNMAETLHFREPMARHVSWRAGGPADRLFVSQGIDELSRFLRSLPKTEPLLFVGLGSNLLVRDGGLRGTVVLMHSAKKSARLDSGLVYAEAGVASPKVARFAAREHLSGAEFLSGIPGTVGGALAMNAGCYGGETWDIVEKVLTVDRAGAIRERRRQDYDIGYRHCHSRPEKEEWFVAAWFVLKKGDGAASQAHIKELLAKRSATQPLSLPNAGSVFRNPPGEHAARLIESCGLKGLARGGARVSEKHANFIVNPDGAATATDIEELILQIKRTVFDKTGTDLVPEVRIVGEPA
jgi:UDP-N-acetylmuramate dehydrogenase